MRAILTVHSVEDSGGVLCVRARTISDKLAGLNRVGLPVCDHDDRRIAARYTEADRTIVHCIPGAVSLPCLLQLGMEGIAGTGGVTENPLALDDKFRACVCGVTFRMRGRMRCAGGNRPRTMLHIDGYISCGIRSC